MISVSTLLNLEERTTIVWFFVLKLELLHRLSESQRWKFVPGSEKNFCLRPSTKSFRYADTVEKPFCLTDIRLVTPTGTPNICVKLDVVFAGNPALLGLNVLDYHHFKSDTVLNRSFKRSIFTASNGEKILDRWMESTNDSRRRQCICWYCSTRPYFSLGNNYGNLVVHLHIHQLTKLFNLLKEVGPNVKRREILDILKVLLAVAMLASGYNQH